jgi:putative transport protein
MNWTTDLAATHPIAHAVLALAVVAALGLALGGLRVRGIGLGIAGVLFAGIAMGHFGLEIDHTVQDFVREFGLVLFVYTIGMQAGPGFFVSLRRHGLQLNLLAASTVLLGAAFALAIGRLGHFDLALTAGLFSGATTNTPALGAVLEALKSVSEAGSARHVLPGIGYAVAYPFGILGIILAMLALRAAFKISISREVEAFELEQQSAHEPLGRMNVRVDNENFDGLTIAELPALAELGIAISRVRHRDATEVETALAGTKIRCGDVLLAVGTASRLEKFRLIAGERSTEDLMKAQGRVTWRPVRVTARAVLGKPLRELALDQFYGVTVTRVNRAAIELPPSAELRLQFGDTLQVVGPRESMPEVMRVLGDSASDLSHTNFVAVFIGIALGVLVGMYPFQIGGLPAPLRLGLAGGPLIVAILLSRARRIGPVIWHMPPEANTALRELGIVLFLACVGMKAGGSFFKVLLHGDGLLWMGAGAIITIVPLLIVGGVARAFFRLNFMRICGLLAGSMTDPPALAFAHTITRSDAPSVAYASVYPLAMLLRILIAQLMILM